MSADVNGVICFWYDRWRWCFERFPRQCDAAVKKKKKKKMRFPVCGCGCSSWPRISVSVSAWLSECLCGCSEADSVTVWRTSVARARRVHLHNIMASATRIIQRLRNYLSGVRHTNIHARTNTQLNVCMSFKHVYVCGQLHFVSGSCGIFTV